MRYDVEQYFDVYKNIEGMLEGIPRQLWSIFLPKSEGDLPDLDANILAFKRRAAERERVMAVQSLCELPLRPNQPLSETQALARIKGAKKARMLERRGSGRNSRNDYGDSGQDRSWKPGDDGWDPNVD